MANNTDHLSGLSDEHFADIGDALAKIANEMRIANRIEIHRMASDVHGLGYKALLARLQEPDHEVALRNIGTAEWGPQ